MCPAQTQSRIWLEEPKRDSGYIVLLERHHRQEVSKKVKNVNVYVEGKEATTNEREDVKVFV